MFIYVSSAPALSSTGAAGIGSGRKLDSTSSKCLRISRSSTEPAASLCSGASSGAFDLSRKLASSPRKLSSSCLCDGNSESSSWCSSRSAAPLSADMSCSESCGGCVLRPCCRRELLCLATSGETWVLERRGPLGVDDGMCSCLCASWKPDASVGERMKERRCAYIEGPSATTTSNTECEALVNLGQARL